MSESNILRNILSYTEMAVLAASILIDGVARQVYPLIPIDAGSTLIELCIGEKTRFCLQFLKGRCCPNVIHHVIQNRVAIIEGH